MWLIILSDQLSVLGLVSRYLTNYLMDRGLIKERCLISTLSSNRPQPKGTYPVLARLSAGYPDLYGKLPTCYSPVRRSTR